MATKVSQRKKQPRFDAQSAYGKTKRLLADAIAKEYNWLSLRECAMLTDTTHSGFPIVYAGEQFLQLVKYTKVELIGKSFCFLFGRHTNLCTLDKIHSAIKKGEEFIPEIVCYCREGTPIWFQPRLLPLHANPDSKKPSHYIFIVRHVHTIRITQPIASKWFPPEVATWLEHVGLALYAKAFIKKDINGKRLFFLTRVECIKEFRMTSEDFVRFSISREILEKEENVNVYCPRIYDRIIVKCVMPQEIPDFFIRETDPLELITKHINQYVDRDEYTLISCGIKLNTNRDLRKAIKAMIRRFPEKAHRVLFVWGKPTNIKSVHHRRYPSHSLASATSSDSDNCPKPKRSTPKTGKTTESTVRSSQGKPPMKRSKSMSSKKKKQGLNTMPISISVLSKLLIPPITRTTV